ncbi:MAG: hypothetical protein MRZ61_01555 [Oscillospiraceae bacterium]|nr:hypothetical protein [Oscillospiraceae bacterium]
MCEEIDEAEIKRKKRASRQKWLAAVLLVLIFAVPAVVMFNNSYASWRIFTKSRIKELEQVFSVDFPENTVFERYKKVYAFQEGACHTLYITGIEASEDFCRSCIGGEIKSMTYFSGKSADEIPAEYWYDGSYRKAEFMCRYGTKGSNYTTDVYFFNNDSGDYDVKFIK